MLEDNQELTSNILQKTREKTEYTMQEIMIITAIKRLKNPFRNLTVSEVAKDLKMGENLANQLFKRNDLPSVNIGKTKTVTLLAYLLWKMERKE